MMSHVVLADMCFQRQHCQGQVLLNELHEIFSKRGRLFEAKAREASLTVLETQFLNFSAVGGLPSVL